MDTNTSLRALPKTDEVLVRAELASALERMPRAMVLDAVRGAIEAARARILAGEELNYTVEDAARDAAGRAVLAERHSLRRVINATGIIVHTNLGRSVLSEAAVAAVAEVATHYSTLEYDVESGERGSRHVHCEELLCRLTGAEAAMAVNNNAAAVMIGLAALARGHEAIVSRGQLVEIGGSFRIPDIMRESGATMVEVGTTNKTHLRDYENALTDKTGLILKVHSSNYRVVGFTSEVETRDLVDLGAPHAVPVMEDQGSGVLVDLQRYGLPYEPTVARSIEQGAAVVTCSGDKLLGGPQAGILVGRHDIIQRLKKHPMARALRLDKMTLAALEATLRAYLDEERAVAQIPTLRMLTMPLAQSSEIAEKLAQRVREAVGDGAEVTVAEDVARAGGGSLPITDIPTAVVAVAPRTVSVVALENALRTGAEPAIIGRVKEERLLLDPRTLVNAEEHDIVVRRLGEIL
ncbi:MAG: L-seryl-tRNA(Sec) selenium transferase [Actinobacteria bacterium HGW-Actinobacteria-7]|jgi:L-seryl-tRNA(Ser) seleniumtransferase|nr:MAG: L-seryl-tRNA(Sec) selenium transferase [Actinobacteria bacterium HGW-Actinobacteria-7]